MDTNPFEKLTKEQQDRLIDNAVYAYQSLYRTVLERKAKELISEALEKNKFKKQYEKRIQVK